MSNQQYQYPGLTFVWPAIPQSALGGNIIESGTRGLCNHYCETFEEVLAVLK